MIAKNLKDQGTYFGLLNHFISLRMIAKPVCTSLVHCEELVSVQTVCVCVCVCVCVWCYRSGGVEAGDCGRGRSSNPWTVPNAV